MNNDWNKEFALFLESSPDDRPTESPPEIVKDLVGSRIRLAFIYSIGSLLAYAFSLLLCAQCSIGLSPLAWKTSSYIHVMPDPWCALLCGAIFGIFPFLAALIFLTRFQHRYLLFRMPWLPLLLPLIASLAMTRMGMEHDLKWYAIWLFAALGTPYALEGIFGWLTRQKRFRNEALAES